jgi:hypothetical protein
MRQPGGIGAQPVDVQAIGVGLRAASRTRFLILIAAYASSASAWTVATADGR